MKNILLASYGFKYPNGDLYDKVTYSLKNDITEKKTETRYFFLGLEELLDITFDRIILFLTEKSKQAYEADIKKYINEERLKIIIIPEGKTIEEVWKQFDEIVNEGENFSEINVYLDITNGYRHLPLVLYNSLFYLESLSKINISGVYYGAFDSVSRGQTVPVFNLTRLANILRGSFAVKQLEKTGHISEIKDFINVIQKDLTSKKVTKIGKNSTEYTKTEFDELKGDFFEDLQGMILNGLPFESGIKANELLKKIQEFEPSDILAIRNLIQRLINKLDPIAIKDIVPQIMENDNTKATDLKIEKNQIELTEKELNRQLEFIYWHYEVGNISTSLVLLREWIVNKTILVNYGNISEWKDYNKIRHSVENKLNEFGRDFRKYENNKESNCFELLKKWHYYSGIRNQYAHAGYQNDPVDPKSGKKIIKILYDFCLENQDKDFIWKLPEKKSGNGSVLITPMGASSGLLFTAVSLVKADSIIVLTSEKFIPKVNEACSNAGLKDMGKVHILTIKDAFCGFNEANEIYKQMADFIKNPKEININLTGGTTAMQWAMQTAYENLLKENTNVKRIAFVDRRPTVEQQSNPYVLGELLDVERLISN